MSKQRQFGEPLLRQGPPEIIVSEGECLHLSPDTVREIHLIEALIREGRISAQGILTD